MAVGLLGGSGSRNAGLLGLNLATYGQRAVEADRARRQPEPARRRGPTVTDWIWGIASGASPRDIRRIVEEDELRQAAIPQREREAQLRAEALAGLHSMFAPQTPGTGVGGGGLPTLREAAPALARAQLAGIEGASGLRQLLEQTSPDIQNINGFTYDRRDPGALGRYFPSLEAGQVPLFDERGNVVAVRNIDGAVQAVGERERAIHDAQNASRASFAGITAEQTAAGQARGSAPYDLVTVEGPDGAPITASRAALLAQEGGIRGLAPAEQARATAEAQTEAQRAADRPRIEAMLADLDRRSNIVEENLSRAIELAGRGETGIIGASMRAVPGTQAYDLRRTLDTILANIGFDELQAMRNNSPTGGALGQVTVREIELLQALRNSLDQGQSRERFVANAQRILQDLQEIRRQRAEAYRAVYGGGATPPPPSVGQVVDGYRYRGGDPANPASWERVR